jgi:hypothetical protein
MKNTLQQIIFGKDKRSNGILAMMVVGFIALGCSCLKDLNKQPTDNPPPTNQGSSTPTTPTKQNGSVPTNSNGELPSDAEIEAIVQETIQDFATGVSGGDFSDMYEKSAKGFKKTYTNDSVKTNFIAFVNQKDRVVPLLRSTASMTPSFTGKPAVSNVKGYKTLTANGSYPTSPSTNFELQYWLEDKKWKMIAIRLRIQ